MERGLSLFSNLDFNVKVLDLNGYKDPAEAAEKIRIILNSYGPSSTGLCLSFLISI